MSASELEFILLLHILVPNVLQLRVYLFDFFTVSSGWDSSIFRFLLFLEAEPIKMHNHKASAVGNQLLNLEYA